MEPEHCEGSLAALAALALVAGAGSGLVVALFRLALAWVEEWRGALIARAHHQTFIGFLSVVVGCAAAVSLAAWLVRRFSPYASGSGIPQVEGALTGDLPPAPPRLLPVKFIGGLLTIGAGMALGREGPSVQMGAVVADLVGRAGGRTWPDLRTLVAAGAGACSPSHSTRRSPARCSCSKSSCALETRVAITALGASSAAILISRLFLGDMPDFQVIVTAQSATATGPLPYAVASTWPLYLMLGVVCLIAACLYYRAILVCMSLAARLDQRCPVELQAAFIGALVGAVFWFVPWLIVGVDEITQSLLAVGVSPGAVPLSFVVRFCLGSSCYAARTPGAVRAAAGARRPTRAALLCALASRLPLSRHLALVVCGRLHQLSSPSSFYLLNRDRARHLNYRSVHDFVAYALLLLCLYFLRQLLADRTYLYCCASACQHPDCRIIRHSAWRERA